MRLAKLNENKNEPAWGPEAAIFQNQRKHRRRNVRIEAALADAAGTDIGTCMIMNISEGGARLSRLESVALPDKFYLLLTKGTTVRRLCEVAWRNESEYEAGVRFLDRG